MSCSGSKQNNIIIKSSSLLVCFILNAMAFRMKHTNGDLDLKKMYTNMHERQRQKKYLLTRVSSEDSDQPAHSCSLIRLFFGRIKDSQCCNDVKFLHADNKDYPCSLTGFFVGRKCRKVRFLTLWLVTRSFVAACYSTVNKLITAYQKLFITL